MLAALVVLSANALCTDFLRDGLDVNAVARADVVVVIDSLHSRALLLSLAGDTCDAVGVDEVDAAVALQCEQVLLGVNRPLGVATDDEVVAESVAVDVHVKSVRIVVALLVEVFKNAIYCCCLHCLGALFIVLLPLLIVVC